jgi:tellurite resistance protein TerC
VVESAGLVAFWCLLAAAFNGLVAWQRGGAAGMQFLTGFALEWSLSVDNVFMFAVVFQYFGVSRRYQRRVLSWGVLGAIVMRLGFILAGAALVARFQVVWPVFGALLLWAAVRLARQRGEKIDPQRNLVLRLARRWLPIARATDGVAGSEFFVRQEGRLVVTPLLVVLLVIEGTDLVFAIDSVPAIFGITQDPFIVFTSNVFAILGLRALYFLLAGAIQWLGFLNYALAAILGFIGLKMIGQWVTGRYELVPTGISLLVIGVLLAGGVLASLVAARRRTGGTCP